MNLYEGKLLATGTQLGVMTGTGQNEAFPATGIFDRKYAGIKWNFAKQQTYISNKLV